MANRGGLVAFNSSLTSQIQARVMNFNFPSSIPKHWLGGCAFKTHLLNSYTLIFPEGEKFFIRSIDKFKKQLKDPSLKMDVRSFMQQETQHYLEHEKFIKNLKEQGYNVEHLTSFVKFMTTKVLEPNFSDKINLSITAGLEHFTALLAEIGLSEGFLQDAEPVMKDLFEWHAAEEIEHKNVAYDVLQEVDDSYTLRVVGLFLAYIILASFSFSYTGALLSQDKKLFDFKTIKTALDVLLLKEKLFLKSISIFMRYLDPEFHPSKIDIEQLAGAVFNQFDEGQVSTYA